MEDELLGKLEHRERIMGRLEKMENQGVGKIEPGTGECSWGAKDEHGKMRNKRSRTRGEVGHRGQGSSWNGGWRNSTTP